MPTFIIEMLVVIALALIAGWLIVTGMRVLRRDQDLAWHAVGLTEILLGFLLGGFSILLFISMPAP